MKKSTARLQTIESLEQRWVPATVTGAAGMLFVRDPVGPLAVIYQSGGVATVIDSARTVAVGGVSRGIFITGSNTSEVITYIGAAPLGGNLLINALNGDDIVRLQGSIGGNVTLLGGFGNDTYIVTANLQIGGYLTLADTSGFNDLIFTGSMSVGGYFSGYGLNDVALGGNQVTIGRSMTLSALAVGAGPPLLISQAPSSILYVEEQLTLRGFAGNETIGLAGLIVVGGNTTVDLGGGNNAFALVSTRGSYLGGLFQYNGIAGSDVVTLGMNLEVAGSASVNLGSGPNRFALTGSIDGDLRLTGGNFANTLRIGMVSGQISINLGNGINQTYLTTPPDGQVFYRGGNGTELLSLSDGTYYLYATFGSGTNTLSLNAETLLYGNIEFSTFSSPREIVQPAGAQIYARISNYF